MNGFRLLAVLDRTGERRTYTALEIQARRPPHRTDLCLSPGTNKPVECPET